MKHYACAIMFTLMLCTMSCMREVDKPQPQPIRTVMVENDAGPIMVIGTDTIMTWIGVDGENRITGLVHGQRSGLSINFTYPMRIFVSYINVYKNGKLEKVIDIDNLHPVFEESDGAMVIYDKHGNPSSSSPTQPQYDYYHEMWNIFN